MKRRSLAPRRIAAACAALALLATPALAMAQSAKDIAAARKAFKEGEDAEAAGDLATAAGRFKQALAIKETPQLHLRIGAVQEKLGQWVAALASYQAGLDKAGSQPEVVKVAREQLEALRPRIPRLEIELRDPPADAVVTLDDAPIAADALRKPMLIDPGPHRLKATAAGFTPRDQVVNAQERATLHVDLTLARIVVYTPPPPPSKVPGAALAGAGGAALVVGAVLIGVSYAKDATIDKQCGGSDRLHCPVSMKDLITGEVSTVNAMRFSGFGAALLGAGGVATGAVLLVRGRF